MAILVSCCLLLFTVSHSRSAGSVLPQAPLKTFTAHLDQRIPAMMQTYGIPGVAVALIKDGKTSWMQAYGYANREQQLEMTAKTYCRMESISKSVTAWGVMRLVEQGSVQLDSPLTAYLSNWQLPQSDFAQEEITIKQLLSHSAGLPLGDISLRYAPEEEPPGLKDNLSREARLQQPPGTSFRYSNVGFNLLELLIESVTGESFAEFMQEEVLQPLGMKDSTFSWREELRANLSLGYDHQGNAIAPYVYPEKASGGLISTIEDIAQFVAAGMEVDDPLGLCILGRESIAAMYTPVAEINGLYGLAFDSYGLGHFVERLPDQHDALSHGGQGCGWMTHFCSVPATGDGIVILSNSQRSWPFIASLLSDWAKWQGFESLGMSLILVGQRLLWLGIGLLLSLSIWQLWRVMEGLFVGKRTFALRNIKSSALRMLQSGSAVALILSVLWAANQDYLEITSLFPIASTWLGVALLVCAAALLFSALTRGDCPPVSAAGAGVVQDTYPPKSQRGKEEDGTGRQ